MIDRKHRKLALDSAVEYSQSLNEVSPADLLESMGVQMSDEAKKAVNRCEDVFLHKSIHGSLCRQWGEITEEVCNKHYSKCWAQHMRQWNEICEKYGIVVPKP